jgi:hypothetical protein
MVIIKYKLVKTLNIESKQNRWKDLWNIYKKMYLWLCVKWALLSINMAENRNYPITYGGHIL